LKNGRRTRCERGWSQLRGEHKKRSVTLRAVGEIVNRFWRVL
jgi:hypothetical protein